MLEKEPHPVVSSLAVGDPVAVDVELERERLAARGSFTEFSRNPWLRFIVRRLIGLVGVLAALVVAVFFMVHLIPGDPVIAALGVDTTPAEVAAIKREHGLDKPLYIQFVRYVEDLLHGDLGTPFGSTQPVSDLIRQRFRASVELAGASLATILVLSIILGMAAAAFMRDGRRRPAEVTFLGITSTIAAIPDYLLGVILVFLFAVHFRWFPVAGEGSLDTLILPTLALSLGSIMTLARIVRVETLNALTQDYIMAARSQRLPWWHIYFRHVLPNVLTAALTVGGLLFASVMGGAILIETVFNRAGLGSALVTAVINQQYVVVQGITLVLGAIVVGMNAIVDFILAAIDSRSLAKEA